MLLMFNEYRVYLLFLIQSVLSHQPLVSPYEFPFKDRSIWLTPCSASQFCPRDVVVYEQSINRSAVALPIPEPTSVTIAPRVLITISSSPATGRPRPGGKIENQGSYYSLSVYTMSTRRGCKQSHRRPNRDGFMLGSQHSE
jgi:hypothetical protein